MQAGNTVILVADERHLRLETRKRATVIVVFGGLFTAITAAIWILDRNLIGYLIWPLGFAGVSLFATGLGLLQTRHRIYWNMGRREITESGGLLRRWRRDQPINAFNLVSIDTLRAPASAHRRRIPGLYGVSLEGKAGAFMHTLGCGDYEDADQAILAGARLAIATDLAMVNRTPETGPVTSTAEQLRAGMGRAQDFMDIPWWRRTDLIRLILVNLVPVAGVLVADWDIPSLILLYWCEVLTLWFFVALKIPFLERRYPRREAKATVGSIAPALMPRILIVSKIIETAVFLGTGGLLGAIGLAAIVAIFSEAPEGIAFDILYVGTEIFRLLGRDGLWIGVLLQLLSHGFAFVTQFLNRLESRRADFVDLLAHPLQLLIFSLIFVMTTWALQSVPEFAPPLAILIAMVVTRTGLDVHWYLVLRRRFLMMEYEKSKG